MFEGDRKRGLKEVTTPPANWRGKFVIFILDQAPLFVSVLEDDENRNNPQGYDHGLCEYAVRMVAELDPDPQFSYGGGELGIKGQVLYIYGGSGEYGLYARNQVLAFREELMTLFHVKEVNVE
ncbi:MAG: hypothetical protein ABH896_01780 [Candidatus Jacksonbacteria bacterium]